MLEAKRQQVEGGGNKAYRGLPVTSIAFILPLAFWLQFLMSDFAFLVFLHFLLALVAFLFILDFPLKKPSLKQLIALMTIVALTVGTICLYTRFKIPAQTDESNMIVEEIMGELYETENP